MLNEDKKLLIKKIVKVFYIPVILLVFWGDWSSIALAILVCMILFDLYSDHRIKKEKKKEKREQQQEQLAEQDIAKIRENAEKLLSLKQSNQTIPKQLLDKVEADKASEYMDEKSDKALFFDLYGGFEIYQLYNQIDLLDAKTYNDFFKLTKGGKAKLTDIPIKHQTQELCLAAVKTGSQLTDVPEKYINEEMCRFFVEAYPWNFYDIPEQYLTYDLCYEYVGFVHLGAIPEKFRDKAMCLKAMFDYDENLCPYIEEEDAPMHFIPNNLKDDVDINTKANEIGWIGKYKNA